MKRVIIVLFMQFIFILSGNALAGTQAIREKIYDFNQIAALAKGLERVLAEKRAHVALIARVGLSQKILPPEIQFSHAGFAVYSKIKTRDDRLVPGYAVYNLYQGEERTGKSHLAQDYPVDYLAVAQVLKVGVIIPNEKLQRTLARTIFSDKYKKLHNPYYSVLSNPFNADFQNCTEFVLDVLFSAIYKISDINKLKVYIASYFDPQPIYVDKERLNMAANIMPDLTIDDHDGPIATTTFSSIARFLLSYDIAEEVFIYEIDANTLYGEIKNIDL